MMFKKIFLILVVFPFLIGAGMADLSNSHRGLFGPLDGYLMITNEKYLANKDQTLYRSELSFWKDFKANNLILEPYYYFKNEAFNSFTESVQLTENLLGLDFIIQQNDAQSVTFGFGYKSRYTPAFGSDSLLLTKFRLDF